MNTPSGKMQRAAHLARMQGESFDLLVIGGGATGAGIALDAAARGLSVALVEREDFAAGTSSRSTKLVHGGVRYLEAAITQFDRAQFHLLREALAERAILLRIAPHLVQPLRTVVPVYSWREALMYRLGLWLYDRAAGAAAIEPSRFLSRARMLHSFPQLRRRHLKGGVAYYDGQFDDARMAIALLVSAAEQGAAIVNRVEAMDLIGDAHRLTGARLRDCLDGREFTVHARVLVNATGPGSDHLRRLEDPHAPTRLAPSRGTHLMLDSSWTPAGDGLLIPRTPDGRVLFVLPWQGATLVGTTDIATLATRDPVPSAAEIDYLLLQLAQWFDPPPPRNAVRARWAGLRPLVAAGSTASARLVREHHLEVGPRGLITIAGGKWTTYRLMAQETVDRAIEHAGLAPRHICRTHELPLAGAHGFHAGFAAALAREHALDADIAMHLAHAYGGRAADLLTGAGAQGRRRLHPGHPYIEAEVAWARDREMALDAGDVLARRLRLAFIDEAAAAAVIPRVQALLRSG